MIRFTSTVPVLRVSDFARSIAWYQNILGFTADASLSASPNASVLLERDDARLMLRGGKVPIVRPLTGQDWDVYLRLDGGLLGELLDHARKRTPLVRGPEVMPTGMVEFELEDPDGYRICIAELLPDTTGFPRAID